MPHRECGMVAVPSFHTPSLTPSSPAAARWHRDHTGKWAHADTHIGREAPPTNDSGTQPRSPHIVACSLSTRESWLQEVGDALSWRIAYLLECVWMAHPPCLLSCLARIAGQGNNSHFSNTCGLEAIGMCYVMQRHSDLDISLHILQSSMPTMTMA